MGDYSVVAWVHHLLGRVAYYEGDADTSRLHGQTSLKMSTELGDDWVAGWALHLLGLAAHIDDAASGREYYHASLEIREQFGDQEGIGTINGLLGMLSLRERDEVTALEFLQKSLLICYEPGSPWISMNMMANISAIAASLGESRRTAKLAGVVAAMNESLGAGTIPIAEREFQRGREMVRMQLTP